LSATGWPSSGIAPPSSGGWGYAGIVHVDGALLTMPFADALAVELVPAALIISNMEAEGDGGPPQVVRGMTPAQFAAFLAGPQSFGGWPGGAAVAAAVAAAYAPETAADAQLAYDAINSDFGLSCAAQSLGAYVAARPQPRSHPLYLMYNAWPRSQPSSPSGAGRWPYHGLDLQLASAALAAPNATDLEGGARIREILGAFAAGRGVLPDALGWPAVAPGRPVATYVLARNDTFPGGGARAVEDFKAAQCATLAAVGFDETYWWCD